MIRSALATAVTFAGLALVGAGVMVVRVAARVGRGG